MKKRLLNAALLVIAILLLTGGAVYGYLYKAPVTISENVSTSHDMIGVMWNQNNTWLADNGFMNSTANDTRVQTLGGLNKPWMVADNKTLTAVPVPADSQTNLYFTTGETEATDMDIIPGYDGYVYTNDKGNLEPGANFIIEQTGYIDMSQVGENITSKGAGFRTYISGTTNITTTITASAAPSLSMLSSSGVGTIDAPPLSKLIDGNTGTDSFHTDTAGAGSYVLIDYGVGNAADLTGWKYYVGGVVTATWNIQYSSDNSSWTNAYTGLDCSGGAGWKTANWASVGSYRYWRSYKTDAAAGGDYHAELVLTGSGATATVTADGVSSGEHTIKRTADGTDLKIYIDDVVEDSAALGGATVADNANDWLWMTGNSMPYADSISVSVNGTRQLWYNPNDIISGTTLPDRDTAVEDNPGYFVWGANPAGVLASVGSMSSSGQPDIGATADTSTSDLLPVAGGSDWMTEPDVSGKLLTNPIRPLITMVSDNSSFSERSVWIFFGIIGVVSVIVLVGSKSRGHHLITGSATTATILLMVVFSIFPPWAIVFAVIAIWAGFQSERSPTL